MLNLCRAQSMLLVLSIFTVFNALAEERDISERIDRVLAKTPLIDGHNDLAWQYFVRYENRIAEMDLKMPQRDLEPPLHTDIPRLGMGRIGAQFWSVFVPIEVYGGQKGDAALVLDQMQVVRQLVERYPEHLVLALTAEDIRRAHREGKVGSLMSIEGGHAIENSLDQLRDFYTAGVRSMTLTHTLGLAWADSATDEARHGGLTAFGRDIIGEMNRLGMLVDLSHVSDATMHDALDVTQSPVIFSHSAARALVDHSRNVPDEVLRRLRENGGVIMVTFVPSYISQVRCDWEELLEAEKKHLAHKHPSDTAAQEEALRQWRASNPDPGATLVQVADHIDHIRRMIGIEYIGLGGDFDGIEHVVEGLEDVSTYPALFAELMRRGYNDEDIAAIAGENILRVMEENETIARQMRKKPIADHTARTGNGSR